MDTTTRTGATPSIGGTDPEVGFAPVRPVRLYERIVEQIEDAVARGDLAPGQRLPSERELVIQFGTSRATVREALRVLESTGLVRSRPGDPNGPEVLAIDAEALRKPLRRLTVTSGLSLSQLLVSRMMLDSTANRLAAHLRTEEQLAAMEASLAAMRRAVDAGFAAFSEADMAFHEAVTEVAGNPLIRLSHEAVRDTVLNLISDKISQASDSRRLMEQSLHHHERVLAAIRVKDGNGAARAARESLYEYYSSYVPEHDRAALHAMLAD